MGLFDKLKEPVFLKETSDAKDQLEQLKLLLTSVPDDIKSKVEQDIKLLTYGIQGEEKILFELKNSHIPMYVLHDLFLEDNGLMAQIDFLIITKNRNFIIECKNLVGNIEINSSGDFIRTTEFRGKYKKEGIYSPITQNQRHLELIKLINSKNKGNILTKTLYEKLFYDTNRSVVVLANSKTLLNAKFAKKEVKDKIIRADQLIEHIKRVNKEPYSSTFTDKEMEQSAQFFLKLHTQNPVDYIGKYRNLVNQDPTKVDIREGQAQIQNSVQAEVNTQSKAYIELKAYRLKKSREENIKAYVIYSDKQLEELVAKNPRTSEELKTVSGFGDSKCKKYGADILNIIKEC